MATKGNGKAKQEPKTKGKSPKSEVIKTAANYTTAKKQFDACVSAIKETDSKALNTEIKKVMKTANPKFLPLYEAKDTMYQKRCAEVLAIRDYNKLKLSVKEIAGLASIQHHFSMSAKKADGTVEASTNAWTALRAMRGSGFLSASDKEKDFNNLEKLSKLDSKGEVKENYKTGLDEAVCKKGVERHQSKKFKDEKECVDFYNTTRGASSSVKDPEKLANLKKKEKSMDPEDYAILLKAYSKSTKSKKKELDAKAIRSLGMKADPNTYAFKFASILASLASKGQKA